MEKQELDKIINLLENNNSKDIASFGFYFREGEDEMHLKANPSGLELFAAKLLKASRDAIEISQSEKNYIPIGFDEKWIQGDQMLSYIKPVIENRQAIKTDFPKEKTIKDKVLQWGCLILIGIIILSIIIGLITIFNWFFT